MDARQQRKHEKSQSENEPPPPAATMPSDGAVVAATDWRLVFFTLTQGRALPKEILLEIPYSELAGVQRQDDKKRVALRFQMTDGRVFDASTMIMWPNRDNAQRFFDALAR